MEKVKKAVEAGVSVPGAIKDALAMPITVFAKKHGLPRSATSEALNGERRATDACVDALIAELGGSVEEWRELLQRARVAAAAAAA